MKRYTSVMILVLVMCGVISTNLHADDEQKQQLFQKIDSRQTHLIEAADAIWDLAEPGLTEHKSAAVLIEMLEDAGFSIERNVADLETAFIATWGSAGPVIGILAEYDALPGLSQQPGVPAKTALEAGKPGHGCGHNIFGTACVGAAIALKELMEAEKITGTIKLFGCPAEEIGVGKVEMARRGVFNGVDAAVSWHPMLKNRVLVEGTLALNYFEVSFHGKTAHGAADPWNGRSALDALEMFHFGINLMREHIKPDLRIHYIVKNGGAAPNIVPDLATGSYYVRAPTRDAVRETYARIKKIADGAALATETKVEIKFISGLHEELVNSEIGHAHQRNLELAGAPSFSDEDQAFAKEFQKYLGIPEEGLSTDIKAYAANYSNIYSTDVAEVSWQVPVAEFQVAMAPVGAPWHSWVVVSCGKTPLAYKAMNVAAKVLAATSYDLMTDGGLLNRVKEEFRGKTAGKTYVSPMDEK